MDVCARLHGFLICKIQKYGKCNKKIDKKEKMRYLICKQER